MTMYEPYWGLRTRPFDAGQDQSAYYPGASHQAALVKLCYAVENRQAAGLLVGEPGVGKTLLSRILLEGLGDAFAPRGCVVFPKVPADQLIALAAEELFPRPAARAANLPDSIRRLQTMLRENREQGRHAVLVIDETHLLRDEHSLEMVRLLTNFVPEGDPLFTLLLIGQTTFLPVLARTPDLDERLAVKCLLKPMDLVETCSYVQHRLATAGGDPGIFTEAALETVYQLSGGAPRRINRLCDLALLVGFADELPQVDAERIESVARDLMLAPAA